jgi:hypothetical protein
MLHPEGIVTIKDLCMEFKIDDKHARKKLRRAGISKKRWAWAEDDKELERAREVLEKR